MRRRSVRVRLSPSTCSRSSQSSPRSCSCICVRRTDVVGSMLLSRRLLGLYIPLGLFLAFLLFPFYWMVMVSFKPTPELFDVHNNPFLIKLLTLDNYTYLFRETAFLTWV